MAAPYSPHSTCSLIELTSLITLLSNVTLQRQPQRGHSTQKSNSAVSALWSFLYSTRLCADPHGPQLEDYSVDAAEESVHLRVDAAVGRLGSHVPSNYPTASKGTAEAIDWHVMAHNHQKMLSPIVDMMYPCLQIIRERWRSSCSTLLKYSRNSRLNFDCDLVQDMGPNTRSSKIASAVGTRVLPKWSVVRELGITLFEVDDQGAEALATGLAKNSTLKSLSLCSNDIHGHGAACIARSMASMSSSSTCMALTRLRLSCNPIGDSGCASLAGALASGHCQVSSLDLGSCQITSIGASRLARLIASGGALVELDLSWNSVGEAGAISIGAGVGDAIRKVAEGRRMRRGLAPSGGVASQGGGGAVPPGGGVLRVLDLSGNYVGEGGARGLVDAVRGDGLRRLVLSENESIGDVGAAYLGHGLEWFHESVFPMADRGGEDGGGGGGGQGGSVRGGGGDAGGVRWMRESEDVVEIERCMLQELELDRCGLTGEGVAEVTNSTIVYKLMGAVRLDWRGSRHGNIMGCINR